ncbi:tetraacyldisaccharide 4'-kinase [Winogradskyella sp. A3E31]|uniref:tetraacyldisaccharide 4'-kinase n=1 Tax=Winogradskyella sp. A3E31 TaxID=3349637 RepID=UPI00398B7416
MKVVRILLFPIVPIYFVVTWLRNKLYDYGLKSSKSYDFPVVCVGNLSTGGTGKTPMIEYLIGLLKSECKMATLSRGYKRSTTGFVLADENASAQSIGDEPFQFYKKFPQVTVAVDENRQHGIQCLIDNTPKPDVILLDDAFQHRKVKAGLNILLTAYNNLYTSDFVLPTGNLREPRSGAKRADIIVVTKCPGNLKDDEKNRLKNSIKPKGYQSLFFSSIVYSDIIFSNSSQLELRLVGYFTLVTGVANPKPLVEYLKSMNLDFEHIKYDDHYQFEDSDIEELESKELIITTEKDYVRLENKEGLKNKLYYLPIKFSIDREEEFRKLIFSRINR